MKRILWSLVLVLLCTSASLALGATEEYALGLPEELWEDLWGFPATTLGAVLLPTASRRGLLGSVKSVRVEGAEYELQKGQWVEGKRDLAEATSFDAQGCVISIDGYDRRYCAYDHGRLVRSASLDSEGWLRSRYEYDGSGRLVKITSSRNEDFSRPSYLESLSYDNEGRLEQRDFSSSDGGSTGTSFHYDRRRRLIEAVNDKQTMVFVYDAEDRVVRQETYQPDGTLQGTYQISYHPSGRVSSVTCVSSMPAGGGGIWYCKDSIYRYDSKGRRTDVIAFSRVQGAVGNLVPSPDGPFQLKYTFSYVDDKYGNWTKRTTTITMMENGVLISRVIGVEYQTVTYY